MENILYNQISYEKIQNEDNCSEDFWMEIMDSESKRRSEIMRYGFFTPDYCKIFGYLAETDIELGKMLNENKEAVLRIAERN